jgi:hypothetical protein
MFTLSFGQSDIVAIFLATGVVGTVGKFAKKFEMTLLRLPGA